MSLTTRILAAVLKLPPAGTAKIKVRKKLKVPVGDGIELLADHYAPESGAKLPTVLVRTPYGRTGPLGGWLGRVFAERGYQVVIQSTRGTAGSGGEFVFARHEHADGLATIAWLKKQEWFSGELAMIGASYFGFTQWAVAASAGPELKAIVPAITASDFNHFRFPGGTLALELILGWSTMMTQTAATGSRLVDMLQQGKRQARLDVAYNHLPLKEADRAAIDKPSETFQDTIKHPVEDEYWQAVDFSHTLKDVDAAINMLAGWYDLFLYYQLQDYERLRQAGKKPYLLIGPWYHGEPPSLGAMYRDSLVWLDAQLKGQREKLREQPVRLFVMGADKWRDFPAWPPIARPEKWFLQPDGALSKEQPPETAAPDHYRYNPADPTPAVGGNSLGKYMGAKDNRELEARPDVLTYTTAPFKQKYEVIGPVKATLYVRSSLEHTDFFTRLCVVKKNGKSINLCDGIIRVTPGSENVSRQEDGSLCLPIEIWPTAYRFGKGERLRLQVSSGAHPRFVRNPGSGEKIGEETTLKIAEQDIFHDRQHPSSIELPVV